MIRVVVADDQALVRGGFALILRTYRDIEVVGEAEDGLAALDLSRRLHPDVVLMDIQMPGLDGIGATRAILREPNPPHVVVLTTFDVDEYVVEALRAGASGYLLKDVEPVDLADAVRRAARGDLPLAPKVLRQVLDGYVERTPSVTDPRLARLSQREREVLDLMARGLSNAEVAERLVISMPTTKSHVGAILTKLDVRDRVQAAILAHRNGLGRTDRDSTDQRH